MRKILAAAALAASMTVAASAQAADTLHFNITDIDVSIANGAGFCIGCSVTATTASTPITFDLAQGASNTFQFADFDLHGLGLGSAEIDATLTFDSPISGSVGSTGDADYFKVLTLVGWVSGGVLTWNPIDPITAGASNFTVSFQDLTGLEAGKHVADYVTITANTIAASTAAVPEPASWALMIGGFGMAGAMMRRRRTAMVAAA